MLQFIERFAIHLLSDYIWENTVRLDTFITTFCRFPLKPICNTCFSWYFSGAWVFILHCALHKISKTLNFQISNLPRPLCPFLLALRCNMWFRFSWVMCFDARLCPHEILVALLLESSLCYVFQETVKTTIVVLIE